MNNEIVSALRNALSHGSSLDDAINSFINAGYNPAEVREAAQTVGGGATQYVSQPLTSSVSQKEPIIQQAPQVTAPVSKPSSTPQSPASPVSQQAQQPQAKPQSPQVQAPAQMPQAPATTQQLPSTSSNFVGTGGENKETSWLPWIIAYLIVLVLIIAGGLVVWIYFPDIIPSFSPIQP